MRISASSYSKPVAVFIICVSALSQSGCGTLRTVKDAPPWPPGVSPGKLAGINHITGLEQQDGTDHPRYRGTGELAQLAVISPGAASVWTPGASLSPLAASNFLVSAWFKCEQVPSASVDFAVIAGKFQAGTPQNSEWLLGIDSLSRLFLCNSGSGNPARLTAPGPLVTGIWHHVCAEWVTGNRARLFLDGGLVASGTLSQATAGTVPFLVGDAYPSDGAHVFMGLIDEIKIWYKAATPSLVTALYASAPDQDGDGLRDGDDVDDNNDGLPDEWANQYFGDRLGGNPAGDNDDDRMNNLEEYIAGTNPTDPWSQFIVGPIQRNANTHNVEVECSGVTGRKYQVWTRPDMKAGWTKQGAAVLCPATGAIKLPVPTPAANSYFVCVTVSL